MEDENGRGLEDSGSCYGMRRKQPLCAKLYFQSAHLLSALVVNTWSPGSLATSFR